MDQKYTNDTMLQYYKGLDENLAWLTQKSEEPKCNKGNSTPHLHTADELLECVSSFYRDGTQKVKKKFRENIISDAFKGYRNRTSS